MAEPDVSNEPSKAEVVAGATSLGLILGIAFGPCCLKFALIILVVVALLKFIFN
jgi:hypothetical protein